MLSNVLYTEYMDDVEYNTSIAMEAAEIHMDRVVSAYNAICEKAEMDLREAELKCCMEGGDMDMLESLYMEANEQTAEKKQGFFAKAWEAIKNFFKSIIAKITGKVDTVPDEGESEVNGTLWGKFKDALSKVKSFLSSQNPKALAAAAAAVTAVLGVTAVGVNKKIKNSELKKTKQEAEQAEKSCNDFADKVKTAGDSFITKLLPKGDDIKAFTNKVSSTIKDFGKAVQRMFSTKELKMAQAEMDAMKKKIKDRNGLSDEDAENAIADQKQRREDTKILNRRNRKLKENKEKAAQRDAKAKKERQEQINAKRKHTREFNQAGGFTEENLRATGMIESAEDLLPDGVMFESVYDEDDFDLMEEFASDSTDDISDIDQLLSDIM